MKKTIIYSFVAIALITSCRKSDIPNMPAVVQVPMPTITLATGNSTTIPLTNTDAYTVTVTLDNYFKTGTPPLKFDLVVEKNGDPTQVKVIQAGVTTFPTTIPVTGLLLRTLYGVAIAGGDTFTIGADVYTQDGTKYPAFLPAGAVTYSPTDSKIPGSSTSVKLSAPAKFVVSAYGAFGAATPYIVKRDDWADYTVGQVIPVTVVDATHISFFYATDVNPKPIVITVDPNSNITSVPLQNFGGYSSLPSYGTWTAVSISDPVNDVVTPTSVTISVNLDLASTTKGDFGSNIIVLQRK